MRRNLIFAALALLAALPLAAQEHPFGPDSGVADFGESVDVRVNVADSGSVYGGGPCSNMAGCTSSCCGDHYGADLTRGELTVREYTTAEAVEVGVSPRIGINKTNKCVDWPLRFFIKGNAHVSKGG